MIFASENQIRRPRKIHSNIPSKDTNSMHLIGLFLCARKMQRDAVVRRWIFERDVRRARVLAAFSSSQELLSGSGKDNSPLHVGLMGRAADQTSARCTHRLHFGPTYGSDSVWMFL